MKVMVELGQTEAFCGMQQEWALESARRRTLSKTTLGHLQSQGPATAAVGAGRVRHGGQELLTLGQEAQPVVQVASTVGLGAAQQRPAI